MALFRTLFITAAFSLTGSGLQAQTCVDVCPSSGLNSTLEWIRVVDMGPLFNLSGNNGGYADFGTSIAATFDAGDFVSYQVQPGYGDGPFTETWRGWMDFNHDGDFDDDGELILSHFGQGIQSGSFFIPTDALNGLTKLRISMSFAIVPGCGDFPDGEVEDYCITIAGGVTPTCDAPSPITGLNANVDSTVVQLTWNPLPLSLGCQVSGGLAPDFSRKVRKLGSNVSSVNIPRSLLVPGTYNWKVVCACAISPVPDITPDSAIDTFVIPALRETLLSESPVASAITRLELIGNPVTDVLGVRLATQQTGASVFRVVDATGRLWLEETRDLQAGEQLFSLSVSDLPAGTYWLQVSTLDSSRRSAVFVKP